jgi:hypothetical protein
MGKYNDSSVSQCEYYNRTLKWWSHDDSIESFLYVLIIQLQFGAEVTSTLFPTVGNAIEKFLLKVPDPQ